MEDIDMTSSELFDQYLSQASEVSFSHGDCHDDGHSDEWYDPASHSDCHNDTHWDNPT